MLTAERREFKRPYGPNISLLILLALMAIGLAGGSLFLWNGGLEWWPTNANYSDFYKQMNLAPFPKEAERNVKIRASLDKLVREPCFKDAALELSQRLYEADYPRESANLLVNFGQRCGASRDYEVLAGSYFGYRAVGDLPKALTAVEQLVSLRPADHMARGSRGELYEQMAKFNEARRDYIARIELGGDPSHTPASWFYDISRMYAALGRFCDAIGPLETHIAFNSIENRTTQLAQLISEYADKGNCASRYAIGSAHVPFLKATERHIVSVLVNGVPGKLLVDTGASYVALSRDFAAKARVRSEGDRLPMKTPGGQALTTPGYAETVSVDKAAAHGVPLAILDGQSEPFGPGLDGLLGMSFLSRFKVQINESALELEALSLH